jgi:hypothetical protein
VRARGVLEEVRHGRGRASSGQARRGELRAGRDVVADHRKVLEPGRRRLLLFYFLFLINR